MTSQIFALINALGLFEIFTIVLILLKEIILLIFLAETGSPCLGGCAKSQLISPGAPSNCQKHMQRSWS